MRSAVFDYKRATGLWPIAVSDLRRVNPQLATDDWTYSWRGYTAPPHLAVSPAMHCIMSYTFPDGASLAADRVPNEWNLSCESPRSNIRAQPTSWNYADRDDGEWRQLKIAELKRRLKLPNADVPNSLLTMRALVSLLATSNDLPEALDALATMLIAAPNDAWPRLALVDIGLRLADEIVTTEPLTWINEHPSPTTWFVLSRILRRNGRQAEALDLLKRGVSLGIDGRIPWSELRDAALYAFKLKRDEDCLAICDRWAVQANLATFPNRGYSLIRAAVFLRCGQLEAARSQVAEIDAHVRAGEACAEH